MLRRFAMLAVLWCAGCGGEQGTAQMIGGGGASCPAYQVPAGTDLTTPTVSFKSDVMKVFNNSCGLSTCHGSTSMPQGGLFLGAEGAMRGDAATVYAGLVGRASAELPSMPFVTAGDPARSYLLHKIDGDQCQFDPECAGGNCQAIMPSGGTQLLPVATRDILRRWIAQGARND